MGVGTRAVKFMGTSDSEYVFSGNVIFSNYTNTPDDEKTLGNGMFSVISGYRGNILVERN